MRKQTNKSRKLLNQKNHHLATKTIVTNLDKTLMDANTSRYQFEEEGTLCRVSMYFP